MKFSDLKINTQLSILSDLAELELVTQPGRWTGRVNPSTPVTTSTGLLADLKKHGLSHKCLDNEDYQQIVVKFNNAKALVPTGPYANSQDYLNISKSQQGLNSQAVVLAFGNNLNDMNHTELAIDGMITGRLILNSDNEIKEALELAHGYLEKYSDNTTVSEKIRALIDACSVAEQLPEELLVRISSWTSTAVIMGKIASKIQHEYFHERDNDGDLPLITGNDAYVIRNLYHRNGFDVFFNTTAGNYSNHRLEVSYVANASLSEGTVTVSVTYNGVDPIELKQAVIPSTLSASEIIDTVISLVNSVREDKDWGVRLTELIAHLSNTLSDVKPFIVKESIR